MRYRKYINNGLRAFGYELRKTDTRTSLAEVLTHAKKNGLAPRTVIDVGAAWGKWSRACANVFSDARYFMVEPLEEYRAQLEVVTKEMNNAQFAQTVVGQTEGVVTFHVHPDLEGSSIYLEDEDGVNGTPRRLPCATLNTLRRTHALEPPFLLKLDVQGAELEALRGGTEVLRDAEYVILEVSLFSMCRGAPAFDEVISFMKTHDFVIYDVLGLLYRPLDRTLCQIDICFVKEESVFRRYHHYATREQRVIENQKIVSRHH